MNRSVSRFSVSRFRGIAAFALLALVSAAAADEPRAETGRDRFTLTFKGGSLTLDDTEQEMSGDILRFNRKAGSVFAVEGEWRSRANPNLAFSVEGMHYRCSFERTSTSENEKAETFAVLAKAKYFFLPGSMVQPYVGGGLGYVTSFDVSGPIEGAADGAGFQGVAGVQFDMERIALRLEYTQMSARLRDEKSDPERFDASNRGFFLGVSILFGR